MSSPPAPVERHADKSVWTFLSNHAHVIILLAADDELRMRDLAEQIGITERAVQRIVADLVGGGFLLVSKDGRRNRYTVQVDMALRHPVEAHRTVKDLLRVVR